MTLHQEYNGVLALFTLYAITYLPFAITSILGVPVIIDNISVLLLYSTIWLDPLLLLLTRVMLRRALDRMCFEVGREGRPETCFSFIIYNFQSRSILALRFYLLQNNMIWK